MPARLSAEACTKISLPPRSDAIKPNPFIGVVPLDRAEVLDGGLVVRRIHGSLRSSASGRLLLCGAAVDTQDFGYLGPLLPGAGADLERRARRHAIVAAALDYTHMQEGIAGPIGKLYEAESLVRIVPFDDGLNRGTGGCFKPLGAKFRCQIQNCAGVVRSCRRRSHGDVPDENLCLCCSLEFLGPSAMLAL